MLERTPFLVPPYSALAEVYDRAGFADYSERSIPRYLAYAQSLDWAGRRVIDLGCGTGVTSWWVSQQGYRVLGIDSNAAMLAQAQAKVNQAQDLYYDPPDFVQMDMRQLESPMGLVDLVLAVGGVLNALQSLRELESTFQRVHAALEPGRLFVFDVRTIRGLALDLGNCDQVYYDNGEDLCVTVRNRFSFETLSSMRYHTIWRVTNGMWQRQDEIHIERGYPTQGINVILERTGFRVRAVLSAALEPFDAQEDVHGQVVFVAEKPAETGA